MNARNKASGKRGGPRNIHWIQAVGWATFLSLVMFGFGLMLGMRMGEHKAVHRASRAVVRQIPPQKAIAPTEEAETPFSIEDSREIWPVLEGEKDSPFPEELQFLEEPSNTPNTDNSAGAGQQVSTPKRTVDSGSVTYTVQVASVRSKDRAEAFQKELVEKGYPSCRVNRAEIPGRGTWYRIRVGLFDNRVDAERLAAKIWERERQRPQVVLERD